MYLWYLKQSLMKLFQQYSFLHGFYDPYRLDRNRNGGGIMLYIREDIPTRLIEKKLWNNS